MVDEGFAPTDEPSQDKHARTNEGSSKGEEPMRSKKARTFKSFGPDFHTYMLENKPNNLQDAFSSPKTSYWKETINTEMDSILQNHIWELVDLPPGTKPLGCT